MSADNPHKFGLIIAALLWSLPAHARKITLVALGDSTTAGTPFFRSPLEAPPDGEGDPEGQFTYWIKKKHPEWTIFNHGIAGQRTDGLRDRLEGVMALNPDYVIVLGGVNDIYQNIDPEMTTRNLSGMYREIKRRTKMPIAASILPFDRATAHQSAEIERLNKWIADAAVKLRIPYVDLHAVVADRSDPTKLNASPDGLHPDIGAYRQLGNALAAEVERLENERPKER